MPRKTVVSGTSGTTALMTNTLRPTGGVICAISKMRTTMTPNQIGS